jgi:hypothetical protein
MRAFTRAVTRAFTRAVTRAFTRAFTRGVMRAEIGALTVGFACAGVAELATIAFLVAFRPLSKDFFCIDISKLLVSQIFFGFDGFFYSTRISKVGDSVMKESAL